MIKLYMVGVPVDYKREDKKVVAKFKNILLKAKKNSWPICCSSTPEYFRYLAPDGWKTIDSLGLPVYCFFVMTKTLKERINLLVEKLYKLSQTSTLPIISLHPGNPRIGDTAVELLLNKFKNNKDEIAVLEARSGMDMIGDIAEKYFNKKDLFRQYLTANEVLRLKDTKLINKGMLLIYCLSNLYSNGNKKYFISLITKLNKLGLGDRRAYIKSPGTKGVGLKVSELMKNIYELNLADHYTLAIES